MNTIDTAANQALRQALVARLDETMATGPVETQASTTDAAILTGPALMVANIRAQITQAMIARNAATLKAMMDSVIETTKNMVENLAPSEKELELRERKLEELEELRRQFENQEISLEAAAQKFENIAISAADRALLDANMASEAQPKA